MTNPIQDHPPVEKLATGIPGFDSIAKGGLPKCRTTLLAGSAGSAKTVFTTQFLAEGIRCFGQAGVFVTFEESPADIRRNMISLGWDIAISYLNPVWDALTAEAAAEPGQDWDQFIADLRARGKARITMMAEVAVAEGGGVACRMFGKFVAKRSP